MEDEEEEEEEERGVLLPPGVSKSPWRFPEVSAEVPGVPRGSLEACGSLPMLKKAKHAQNLNPRYYLSQTSKKRSNRIPNYPKNNHNYNCL